MSNKLLLAITSLVALGFFGCSPAANLQSLPSETVLFDIFSINYAWGFDCGGCCVDAAGNVRRYDCRGLRDTLRSEEWRGREREVLKRRFHMSDSIVCSVETGELKSMMALIKSASEKSPDEETQTGADAGSVSYTAYLYDSDIDDSTEVLLSTAGDFSREPSTEAAKTLVAWLRQTCACNDSAGAQ